MINEVIEMIAETQKQHGLMPFDEHYKFYFDETNNIRKFYLKPSAVSKVNTEEGLVSDFILGGICFKNSPDVNNLFQNLKLQKNVKELDSKLIFSKKDYKKDFCDKRMTALLKWFDDNKDVYLHYAIENNFYFAIVDIVDSLYENYPQMMQFNTELKSALYDVYKQHKNEILSPSHKNGQCFAPESERNHRITHDS